jgi:hypothetical protein
MIPLFKSFSVNVKDSPDGWHDHAQVRHRVPELGEVEVDLTSGVNVMISQIFFCHKVDYNVRF